MEFDDSNDRGSFCISPTDNGFVEESDHGMRVLVGDVNREVECSRKCKVGLVSMGFLCLGLSFRSFSCQFVSGLAMTSSSTPSPTPIPTILT